MEDRRFVIVCVGERRFAIRFESVASIVPGSQVRVGVDPRHPGSIGTVAWRHWQLPAYDLRRKGQEAERPRFGPAILLKAGCAPLAIVVDRIDALTPGGDGRAIASPGWVVGTILEGIIRDPKQPLFVFNIQELTARLSRGAQPWSSDLVAIARENEQPSSVLPTDHTSSLSSSPQDRSASHPGRPAKTVEPLSNAKGSRLMLLCRHRSDAGMAHLAIEGQRVLQVVEFGELQSVPRSVAALLGIQSWYRHAVPVVDIRGDRDASTSGAAERFRRIVVCRAHSDAGKVARSSELHARSGAFVGIPVSEVVRLVSVPADIVLAADDLVDPYGLTRGRFLLDHIWHSLVDIDAAWRHITPPTQARGPTVPRASL